MKTFIWYITRPFVYPIVIYRLGREMTPEERAQLKSPSVSVEEKNELAKQIARRTFPNIEM